FFGEFFSAKKLEFILLKIFLSDFFRGPSVPSIRLAGLEYVLHFTAVDGKIYMRSYKVLLKKSGCKIPRIELEEMGPSLDLVMRRTHLASDDLYKLSLKQPKALKPKKKKNISHDVFGTTYGRIHMQKQDLGKLQTRKMKGLRKRPAEKLAEGGGVSPKKSKSA
ncbi:RPF2 factor, partial [Zapornia atra]|nr:RPF2 factor [Zapornia atra]